MPLFCLDGSSSLSSPPPLPPSRRRGLWSSGDEGDDEAKKRQQAGGRSQEKATPGSSSSGRRSCCSAPERDVALSSPPPFEAEYTSFPPLKGEEGAIGRFGRAGDGGFGRGRGLLLNLGRGSDDDTAVADRAFEGPEEGRGDFWWGLSSAIFKLAVWMHRMQNSGERTPAAFSCSDEHGAVPPADKRRGCGDACVVVDPAGAGALLADSYPSLDLTVPSSSSSESSQSRQDANKPKEASDGGGIEVYDDDDESTSTSSSMSLSSSSSDDDDDDGYDDDSSSWERRGGGNDSDYFGDLEPGMSSGGDEEEDEGEDDGGYAYLDGRGSGSADFATAPDRTIAGFLRGEEEEIFRLARLYRQRHGIVPSSAGRSASLFLRNGQLVSPRSRPGEQRRRCRRSHRRRRRSVRGCRGARSAAKAGPVQAPTAAVRNPWRGAAPVSAVYPSAAVSAPRTRQDDHSYLYISDPEDSDDRHRDDEDMERDRFLASDGAAQVGGETRQPPYRQQPSSTSSSSSSSSSSPPPCFWPAFTTWFRPPPQPALWVVPPSSSISGSF